MEQQEEGEEAVAAAAAVDKSSGTSKRISVDDFVLTDLPFYDKEIDVDAVKKALEGSTPGKSDGMCGDAGVWGTKGHTQPST